MNNHYPFQLPPLPYTYDAMEPFIDTETMYLHHSKHLATYIENLNEVLKSYPVYQLWSLEQLITNSQLFPNEIRTTVERNAGGVYNHLFFFFGLTDKPTAPRNQLLAAITRDFGCIETFKEQMTNAASSVFGSGYAWLTANKNGALKIVKTPNQQTPLKLNYIPIILIDVWEHAYYLKYQNVRKDYILNWFHIINWDMADYNYNHL